MLTGHQTWTFPNGPVIASTDTVVGPFEGKGPLGTDFDLIHCDPRIGEDSWAKAERRLLEEACDVAIKKAGKRR